MFDSPIFETAIGLCLVFSLFGLLVTAVQELIASLLDSRGKFFSEGVQNLLYLGVPMGPPKPDDSANPKNANGSAEPPGDSSATPQEQGDSDESSEEDSRYLANRVLHNPLVQTLNRGNREFAKGTPPEGIKKIAVNASRPFRRWDNKPFVTSQKGNKPTLRKGVGPSYMPATMFSEILLEEVSSMVGRDRSDLRVLPLLRRGIEENETLQDSQVGKTLVYLIYRAERRVQAGSGEEELLAEIATWFDSGMEQVSGWYRRHTRKAVLILGLALAALFNVDAVRITKELFRNSSLGDEVVAAAAMMNAMPEESEDSTVKATTAQLAETVDSLNAVFTSAGIPMGWTGIEWPPTPKTLDQAWPWGLQVILMLIGWSFTAAAVSLGAPFWFDLLKRVVSIRAGAAPPIAGAPAGIRPPEAVGQAGKQATRAEAIAASGPPQV